MYFSKNKSNSAAIQTGNLELEAFGEEISNYELPQYTDCIDVGKPPTQYEISQPGSREFVTAKNSGCQGMFYLKKGGRYSSFLTLIAQRQLAATKMTICPRTHNLTF